MSTKVAAGMKTVTVRDNYRIEIEAAEGYSFNKTPEAVHAQKVSELEDVRRNINRHVDGVSGIAVLWDTKQVCPHCEEDIKDGWVDGEPQCCTMAQDEFVALGFKLSEA